MKRTICCLLALLLCLALCTAALAEGDVNTSAISSYNPTLAQVVEPKLLAKLDGDITYRTGNRLSIRGENGTCLASMDGTPLTESIYDYSGFTYSYDYMIARTVDDSGYYHYGLLNLDGKELMPFEYSDVEVHNQNWAIGVHLTQTTNAEYDYRDFSNHYFNIVTVDIYHLPEGECVAQLDRDHYEDSDAVGPCINVQDRSTGVISTYDAGFNLLGSGVYSKLSEDYVPAEYQTYTDEESGKIGLADAQGNPLTEAKYESVWSDTWFGDQCIVRGGTYPDTKCGLLNREGKEIVPPEFDDIDFGYSVRAIDGYTYLADGFKYVGVRNDEKLGYYDVESGALSCETNYDVDSHDNNGASATFVNDAGVPCILAGDGVVTELSDYDEIYDVGGHGMFYVVSRGESASDSEYAVVDWHGNLILGPRTDSIGLSEDGHYAYIDVWEDGEGMEIYELTLPEN